MVTNKARAVITSVSLVFFGLLIMSGAVTPSEIEGVDPDHNCVEDLSFDLEESREDILSKMNDIEAVLSTIRDSLSESVVEVNSQTVNVDSLMSSYLLDAKNKRIQETEQ